MPWDPYFENIDKGQDFLRYARYALMNPLHRTPLYPQEYVYMLCLCLCV